MVYKDSAAMQIIPVKDPFKDKEFHYAFRNWKVNPNNSMIITSSGCLKSLEC
jgi:hypothetical protein